MRHDHRTLAIDASSTMIGWCVLDRDTPIAHGTIKLPARADIGQRALAACNGISDILSRYALSYLAYEGPAYKTTPLALIAQQRVMGAILMHMAMAHVAVAEIPPTTAKKALTGSGRADKRLMLTFARQALPGCDEHAADAYAVGLAAARGAWNV